MPKAVQRASPLALAFPFCDLLNLCRRVLVWRSEATPLVIDKHTPWCQLNKFCGLKQNDNYLKNFNYVKKQIFH